MRKDRGVALVLAIMAVALLAALGFSLAVMTDTEMRVAANYSYAQEAMSAAESALELVVHELLSLADWSGVVDGTTPSGFVDGAPAGDRTLSDGLVLNLEDLTEKFADPRMRLFAYGSLRRLAGAPSDAYIVVWIGPDPAGMDGELTVRAAAFGTSGTRRVVQATVSPSKVLSWKEWR